MKFSKIANKQVLLDIPTSTLIRTLKQRRTNCGLSMRELAEKLCVHPRTIYTYEHLISPPCLLNLMNIAEFFKYDLSESLNYKFFHGQIRPDKLKASIKSKRLSFCQLAQLTGYTQRHVIASVRLAPNASIHCLNAVLNVLNNS